MDASEAMKKITSKEIDKILETNMLAFLATQVDSKVTLKGITFYKTKYRCKSSEFYDMSRWCTENFGKAEDEPHYGVMWFFFGGSFFTRVSEHATMVQLRWG